MSIHLKHWYFNPPNKIIVTDCTEIILTRIEYQFCCNKIFFLVSSTCFYNWKNNKVQEFYEIGSINTFVLVIEFTIFIFSYVAVYI